MTKLRVGIIGVGGIAQDRHIPVFLQMKETVDLIAVSDVNENRAREVSEKFRIPLVFQDYLPMLEKIDAVVICTPNKFHAEIAVQALEAGVHVLCEKPMAITTEECEAMVRAANENDRKLSIGYHYRFTKEAQAARNVILQGEIGDPLVAKVEALRRRKVPGWGVFTNKALQGGGCLIDFGCHLLDLALWLLGDPEPVEVLGRSYDQLSKTPNRFNEWGAIDHKTFDVDDHATGYITFKNGISLMIECSWAANIKEDATTLRISGVDGGVNVYPFELYQEKHGMLINTTASMILGDDDPGLRQTENFVNSCLGIEELVVKPEQALNVTKIIEAIYMSSESGKSVRF